MGWIKRSWQWLTLADLPTHQFMAEPAPRPVDQVIFEMKNATGRVGRDEALSVPGILRGRNLICSIATLPLIQVDGSNRTRVSPLLDQIDPNVANSVTLAQTVEDLLFEAEAWWRILARDSAGWPIAAQHLAHGTVSLVPPTGAVNPLPSDNDPRGAVVWVDGVRTPARDVIRFDSPNPALLKAGGRAIRRALLLDKMSELYADGGRPLDYFTPRDGVDPAEDDAVQEILDSWKAARKKGSTAYVPAALEYNAVDVPTPADLQLVGLQQRASLDIANALGLDPEDLGISTTTRTYQNATDRRKDRINDVLSPYMRAVTDRLTMPDVTPAGNRVVFDLDDYLRADPTTRWNTYEKAIQLGVISREEVRDEEGLPPGAPQVAASPTTGGTVTPLRQVAAAAPAVMNFDAESVTFVDAPVHAFAVDREARTISGRALPYGETASKNLRTFSFLPGSLQWSEISRVKLLRDHDYSQAIGRAISLTDADGGFDVVFSVARGAAGDEALSLAEDGVLDGFSVGVDFDASGDDVDHRDGIYFVRRANLREVSLVAIPAFDSARISRIAASRDQEGATVPDNEPDTATTTPATVGANFSADDVAAFLAAIQGGTATPPPVATSGPATVSLTRGPAQVSEAAPYRFDRKGNLRPGTHDFSSDLHAASKGDLAARDRSLEFLSEQFDVDRADVTALNPNRQRPDLYVDQRSYRYPVWEAINKGTLPDSTPFVFPKFNSASGLVAAHTEGVEPTPGTFTATSQTVTPGAVSGKVEITREAWDQGGNPQMSNLIWRQMVKAYNEALEARAVAVLDAATPAALATFTAGGGTNKATLISELTAGLAGLQFVRGGFSMDTMFIQVDLYKDLIAAKDSNGRPIYPALGPQNAYGIVGNRFGTIEIAPGVVGYPAWALAASGSVAASSYLFDSESVHGWATAPQRLEFNYRVAYVDLAIWGYAAAAISDINGVRELSYDPVA